MRNSGCLDVNDESDCVSHTVRCRLVYHLLILDYTHTCNQVLIIGSDYIPTSIAYNPTLSSPCGYYYSHIDLTLTSCGGRYISIPKDFL